MTTSRLRTDAQPVGSRTLEIFEGSDRLNRWIYDRFAAELGKRVLEIGAGIGNITQFMTERELVVATDIEESYVTRLRERFNSHSAVTVRQLDLDAPDPDFAQFNFDSVLAVNVLEHIDDDRSAVERLRRLVVDDGRLVLSVPAMPSLFGYHDEQLGHYRRYTRHALEAVLAPAFVIERLRYFGFTLVPVTAYYSRLRRRPYPTGSAESGVLSRAFRSLCALEARVPAPLGTSLVCLARPRPPGRVP